MRAGSYVRVSRCVCVWACAHYARARLSVSITPVTGVMYDACQRRYARTPVTGVTCDARMFPNISITSVKRDARMSPNIPVTGVTHARTYVSKHTRHQRDARTPVTGVTCDARMLPNTPITSVTCDARILYTCLQTSIRHRRDA